MVEQVDDNSCYNCNSGQFAMFEPSQIFFDVTAVVPSHCTGSPCLWLKRRIQKQQPVPDTADPSNLSVGIPGFWASEQLENSADVGRCFFRTCRTTRAGSLTFICHVSAALRKKTPTVALQLAVLGRQVLCHQSPDPSKGQPPRTATADACECFMW